MQTFLHITKGDGAAGLLEASGLEGDVLAWRDPMHHGPFPANADLQALSKIRGYYLDEDGVHSPVALFVQNMDQETALYMGDWTTFSRINVLCSGPTPLLRCEPGGTFASPPDEQFSAQEFAAQRPHLTEAGKDVASSRRTAHALLERDEWLGGVNLKSDAPMWRWSKANQQLSREEL